MFIGSEGASHLLFVVCYKVEEENKAETGVFLEKASEIDANDNYICFSLENFNSDKDDSFNKNKNDNYWKNITDSSQKHT